MIDVEDLIAFSAVMDAGSFSGAAERLGQTPSGVSRTIARLEKLHVKLNSVPRFPDLAQQSLQPMQVRAVFVTDGVALPSPPAGVELRSVRSRLLDRVTRRVAARLRRARRAILAGSILRKACAREE